MNSSVNASRGTPSDAIVRMAEFLAFWLVLFGLSLRTLLVGILAAVIATWTSLRLLPVGVWRFRPLALAQLALSFLRQSLGAGIDVAWRALDPRLPLRPGFVIYQPHLPPGLMRSVFCTITSLLPGTLPCETEESGSIVIHCLDASQTVTNELAAQEAALIRALGDGRYDG
ncbi:MAG TPA: Na+/H+ antiporter subunit E [Xanthobacteraceae bacterium]